MNNVSPRSTKPVPQKLTKCDMRRRLRRNFGNAEISLRKKIKYGIFDKYCLIYLFCIIFCSLDSTPSKPKCTWTTYRSPLCVWSRINAKLTNHEWIVQIIIYQLALTFVVGKYENASHRRFLGTLWGIHFGTCLLKSTACLNSWVERSMYQIGQR